MTKKKTFSRGIHPHDHKELTAEKPIINAPLPQKVVIPLLQSVGNPAKCVVARGDMVKKGQLIGQADGNISANVHASISGKVTQIARHVNPIYGNSDSVFIESDKTDEAVFGSLEHNGVDSLNSEQILGMIKDAGIVGLGGAAFPTHIKLNPPKNKRIDVIILNGAECEPYLTCDYRLMMEESSKILKGVKIIARLLGVRAIYIAIEDNKPLAEKAMKDAVIRDGATGLVQIEVVKTKYPQGAEKQLIKSVVGQEVPAGGLPMDVGCLVQNVGTALSVYEAVYIGKPLIERVITITGPIVKNPVNVRVRIGTILKEVVDYFGGVLTEPGKIITGGPMMGISQYTLDVPVVKGLSGVLLLPPEKYAAETSCIRCGRCMDVCPMGLLPTAIMHRVKAENFAEAKEIGLANCFECGCCTYVCPAKIRLIDYMKYGKAKMPR